MTSEMLTMTTAIELLDTDTATRPTGCHRYLLGLNPDETPTWWTPTTDGPLQVISGTGAGATTLLRSLALQALHTGATVDVLDMTWAGWSDLHERQGLTIHNEPTPNALNTILDAAHDTDHRIRTEGRGDLPTRFVVIDELPLLLADDRANEEITTALELLHAQGDAVGIHLLTHSGRPAPYTLNTPHRHGTLALARLSTHTARALNADPRTLPGGPDSGQWTIHPHGHQIIAPAALPNDHREPFAA